ncbi:acyltransferase family protein [Bacillus sp. T33-2]|uniref:acyltransferase family protein n=1 Tax=Bacillus sp. T33-2 TaxID=2054168 RepID=UPI0035B5703E
MNTLKALGIIIVVTGHIAGYVFPPYSFHMPLFVFIFGYFYKTSHQARIFNYVKKKFKDLVIPYYKWNLFYGILVFILTSINLITFGQSLSFHSFFVESWLSGHQYLFNLAAWFVLSLFLIQIIYILSGALLNKFGISNEFLLMGIYLVIGLGQRFMLLNKR